ncbi:hypothetical protein SCACP_10830 [Sporomusa carbonis]
MNSSGSYGKKFGYKLPHAVKANKEKDSPPVSEKDVYVKQEEQFDKPDSR